MSTSKAVLGPMRPSFLILTPACVLLGIGTAVRSGIYLNPLHIILVLIGAVAAHISVNAFNEYIDFKSGLDLRTTPTPFSGGSGTLPAHPKMARTALATALISLAIVGLIGIFFTWLQGLGLLPLGLLGMLVIVAYTPWFTRQPFLCLVAPGLGFGPLMVLGTHFALTGQYSWMAFIASLVPFFLVSNLLLLNQFPDVEPDLSVGRRHYPILIGRRKSSFIFASFLVSTYIVILVGVLLQILPVGSLLGLATLFLALPLINGALSNPENIQKLVPFLGINVLVNLLTPALFAVGLIIH